MTDRNALLKAIAERSNTGRYGISTAASYLAPLEGCFEGGLCPTGMGNVSRDEWLGAVKDASKKFTFCDAGMNIKSVHEPSESGLLLEFDCCVTSTRKDRDGDVLLTSGMNLDPAAPLLWAHSPFHPIGKLLRRTGQTATKLTARCGIMDFGNSSGELATMARDAAVLIKGGCLRISHGFDPSEYEPLDEKDGRFLIRKATILEISVVAIPSNVDAIITNFSAGKLHNPVIQKWAKGFSDARPVQGRGVTFAKDKCGHDCGCGKCKPNRPSGKTILDHKSAERLEANDPIRWNKSAPAVFDVASEPMAPSSTCYDWASKYLGVPIKQIFETSTNIPSARMGSWLTAFQNVTKDYHVQDMRNIHGSHESPPVYAKIELDSKSSATFLIEGTTFYKNGPAPLIIGIEPTWSGVRLTGFARIGDKHFLEELFEKTWELAKQNNFLKGEAFSLSGEFIPRDGINWSDVFLTEKNQKPIVRMINNVNAKQASCPNRGFIFMGNPGTGKTLSGRVIKNLTHATFIWISARDFHRSGSFGGFEYAFDLAKELAPCVLFFEDIDNWIGPSTVDLMKTEMDGLTKSSGIITIMTTNFPENLPEALVDRPGRFHEILKIDLPNEEVRKAMISKWVPGITGQQIHAAVERTKGYSGAHIYELAQFAKAIVETDELVICDALTKALDKIDEQRDMISRNLLQGSRYQPRKDIQMIGYVKSPVLVATKAGGEGPGATAASATMIDPTTNTTHRYEDEEGNRGQGPSQGDHDWPERHMANEIVIENLPGVNDFDVDNDADDEIMRIAMGGMTGAQQNPAHDPALSDNPGPAGQPMNPGEGVQYPIVTPANPSLNPGPQSSETVPPLSISERRNGTSVAKEMSVNDSTNVPPNDSDSAIHHDMAGNVDGKVAVDERGLKSMAAMVKHSGKEGAMYLHPETGHVHHVMAAEDMHPDNAHKYHKPAEIEKMYGCCRGVTGVKCAVGMHPMKGMGYKMLHKGGMDAMAGADPGMGDGMEAAHSPAVKNLLGVKGRMESLFRSVPLTESQRKEFADAYAGVMLALKFSSTNPNGDPEPALPMDNAPNMPSLGSFTGIPANDALNVSSRTDFEGKNPPQMGEPTENMLNRESMDGFGKPMQPNTPASNPPGKGAVAGQGGQLQNALDVPQTHGRRTDPGTMSNESVDGPNIPGSLAFENSVLNEGDVMKWLAESEDNTKSHGDEMDAEFESLLTKELFAGV